MKLATDRNTGEEFAVKIMALPEPNAKAGDNENTRSDLNPEHSASSLIACHNAVAARGCYQQNQAGVWLSCRLLNPRTSSLRSEAPLAGQLCMMHCT